VDWERQARIQARRQDERQEAKKRLKARGKIKEARGKRQAIGNMEGKQEANNRQARGKQEASTRGRQETIQG
jgi:hypothetical protein